MIAMWERTTEARVRSLGLLAVMWFLLPAAFPVMVTATMSPNFQCQNYQTQPERIEIDRKDGNLVEIHIRQNIEVSTYGFIALYLFVCKRKAVTTKRILLIKPMKPLSILVTGIRI